MARRDIRVYYYSGYSVLVKPSRMGHHKVNSIEQAHAVRKLRQYRTFQLVLVEYFAVGESKIIEIMDPIKTSPNL
jgi:hypothetical protein